MPHSRSAKKEHRKSLKRRAQNRSRTSRMRTQIKKVESAAQAGDTETAQRELPLAQKLIDKGAKNHRMHRNRAARIKSRLSKLAKGA